MHGHTEGTDPFPDGALTREADDLNDGLVPVGRAQEFVERPLRSADLESSDDVHESDRLLHFCASSSTRR